MKEKGKVFLKMLFFSYFITAVFILLFSWIVFRFENMERYITIGIGLTYVIANGIAGIYTGHKLKKRRLVVGMITGTIYFVVLLCLSAIFSKINQTGALSCIIVYLMCTISATLGAVFAPQ